MLYTIQVIEPPVTDFTITKAGCVTDSVDFEKMHQAGAEER